LEHLAWLEGRNEQLIQALSGIESERSHYFRLFDLLPVGVCAVGTDGRILDANRQAALLCSHSRDHMVGRPFSQFLEEEDRETWTELLRECLGSHEARPGTLHLTRRAMASIMMSVRAQRVEAHDGGDMCLLTLLDEIPAEQDAKHLRLEAERFHLAARAGGVGIFDWDLQSNRLIWDEQMFRLYGVPPEHFSGAFEAWRAGLHPDDAARAEAEVQQALRGERELDTEFRVVQPGGAIRAVRALGVVLRDADGRPLRMVGTNWDITSLVELKDRLQASESNFRSFFDSVSDLLVVADMRGRIFYSNRAMRTKLGYGEEELSAMHVLDLHPPERRAEAEEIFAAMFRGTRDSCPLPLGKKDGPLFPVETRVWFGRWNNEDCVFGVCKDLSEEEDAKQRFERLFRNNPCPMALSVLPQRWFVDVNDAFMKVLGYPWNEVVGKSSQEINLFVEPEKQVLLGNLLAVGGRFSDVELKVRRRDGSIMVGLFSGELVRSQGKVFFLTVMVDITARKEAEAALAHERERLAAILRGTNVGTWEWNVQTGETVFNERWAAIAGYTLAELAPVSIDTWMKLAHPEDLQHSGEALERHFHGEADYYEVESRMLHKDGSWIWVLDRGRVDSHSEDGRPLMMFGTHQDITQRKNAENALQKRVELEELVVHLSSRLLAATEENISTVLDEVLERVGTFAGVDRSYLFMVHAGGSSMSNSNEWCAPGIEAQMDQLQDLPVDVAPEWLAEMRRNRIVHIPRVAELPDSWSIERELLESQDIQSLLALPILAGGDFLGFIGFDAVRGEHAWQEEDQLILRFLADNLGLTIRGVEQRRELRAATQTAMRLAEAAEAANKAKSLFLANMSHEIRTPMNAIMGFAQVLERDASITPIQAAHVRTIGQSGAQLLRLIDDVLDMSRLETGHMVLHEEAFRLCVLMRELEEIHRPRALAKGLELRLSPPPEGTDFIVADQGKLGQVLGNVLGNAIKFTHAGQVDLAVEITGGAEARLLAFSVRDTGPGISAEDQDHLFDVFNQGRAALHAGGTGLGLSISSRLAAMMGGTLQVESTLGQGSVFTLRVPLRVVDKASAQDASRREVALLRDRPTPLHVLVVDDKADNRAMLCEMLRPLAVRLSEAENGLQAVESFLQDPAQVVLMDMRMPDMDGYEATRRLRVMPAGGEAFILAVTAGDVEESIGALRACGVDQVLRKPFLLEDLVSLLARHLAGTEVSTVAPADASEIGALPPRPDHLAPDMLDRLRSALAEGDTQSLKQHLADLGRQQPDLARALEVLVDRYEYEVLGKWLGDGV